MSNLNLWYCAGIVFLGASFSYIVVTAIQFMEMSKKDPKASGRQGMNGPGPGPTQFVRHALVAFLGIMIGAQLLQYHQDQEELTKKDLSRDMAVARAVVGTPDAKNAGTGPVGFGSRPTQRPPRGYLSVADAEKASAMHAISASSSALKPTPPMVAVQPVGPNASSAAVAAIK